MGFCGSCIGSIISEKGYVADGLGPDKVITQYLAERNKRIISLQTILTFLQIINSSLVIKVVTLINKNLMLRKYENHIKKLVNYGLPLEEKIQEKRIHWHERGQETL